MSIIDAKDFYTSVHKQDIQAIEIVLKNYNDVIINNMMRYGYFKIAFANYGPEEHCNYTNGWRYDVTIFGDPVIALKKCMVDVHGYRVNREIICDNHSRANVLIDHYNNIGKSYDLKHLVVGYEFSLDYNEASKRNILMDADNFQD